MARELRSKMIFHGAVVVLLGLLAGFPYALVRTGSMAGEPRAWSMAHLEGLLNGLILLAVAGVSRRLVLDDLKQVLLAWSLILMAYVNVAASVVAASFGIRGLTPAGPFVNLIVYLLFMLAVVAVLIGMGLVAVGARASSAGSAGRTANPAVHIEVNTDRTWSTEDVGSRTRSALEPDGTGHKGRRSRRRKQPPR